MNKSILLLLVVLLGLFGSASAQTSKAKFFNNVICDRTEFKTKGGPNNTTEIKFKPENCFFEYDGYDNESYVGCIDRKQNAAVKAVVNYKESCTYKNKKLVEVALGKIKKGTFNEWEYADYIRKSSDPLDKQRIFYLRFSNNCELYAFYNAEDVYFKTLK